MIPVHQKHDLQISIPAVGHKFDNKIVAVPATGEVKSDNDEVKLISVFLSQHTRKVQYNKTDDNKTAPITRCNKLLRTQRKDLKKIISLSAMNDRPFFLSFTIYFLIIKHKNFCVKI